MIVQFIGKKKNALQPKNGEIIQALAKRKKSFSDTRSIDEYNLGL